MKHSTSFANETESMPITVAMESKINDSIRVISDRTDGQGVRHLEIQTMVTGKNWEGYDAAELLAKQWFFCNYDRNAQKRLKSGRTVTAIAEEALLIGALDPSWLECPHPQIGLGSKAFGFGHHTGINPKTPEDTWGFHFEIVPLNASKRASMGERTGI
jgi:hypothetical protein